MDAPPSLTIVSEGGPVTLRNTQRIVRCIYDNSANESSLGPVSVISLCFDELANRHYVLKRSSKLRRRYSYMVDEVRSEAIVIGSNLLAHPNIVRGLFAFETEENIYLGMEYASGGSLLDFFVEKRIGLIGDDEVLYVCRQLFSAVEFLHKSGFLHCDVKLENILLMDKYPVIDKSSVIKLADFGYCKEIKNLPKRRTGSTEYAAPELWHCGTTNTERTDVWACGVVLYALTYGEMPFAMQPEDLHTGKTEDQIVIARIAQCHPYRLVRPLSCKERPPPSLAAINLIRSMLEKNAKYRPSMAECNSHAFITGKRQLTGGQAATKSCAAESAAGEPIPAVSLTPENARVQSSD